jgi:hypothetical protein
MWDNKSILRNCYSTNYTNGKSKKEVVTSRVAKTRNGGTMSESAFGFYQSALRQSLDFGLL